MRLNSEQIEQYRRDGYLVVRGAVDTAPIDRLMAFVSHVIRLETGSTEPDEAVLNRVLIELKRDYPTSSSWIYQTILTSWALKRFFTDIAIEPMAMQLLGIEDENNLGTVSPAFRFDIPGDRRNVRTWHQDSAYFLENGPGSEHLVAWIPTNAAYRDNGSVLIAPGTHKDGRLGSEHTEAKGLASEQYTAPEDALAGREILHIDAGPGDVAFIDMDLVHSSGVNITEDSVRYTAQIRFNTINRADYRPVQLKPVYPVYARRG